MSLSNQRQPAWFLYKIWCNDSLHRTTTQRGQSCHLAIFSKDWHPRCSFPKPASSFSARPSWTSKHSMSRWPLQKGVTYCVDLEWNIWNFGSMLAIPSLMAMTHGYASLKRFMIQCHRSFDINMRQSCSSVFCYVPRGPWWGSLGYDCIYHKMASHFKQKVGV